MTTTNDVRVAKKTDVVTRRVLLTGLTDIMFDRYPGDNKTKLQTWQKLYFRPGSRVIGLPAGNISSLLTAQNTDSAPKRFMLAKEYKKTCNGILSFTAIGPGFLPFLRDGKEIAFGSFEEDVDPMSGVYVHYSTARLKNGLPNPKERPVLSLPWSLGFDLTIFPNSAVNETEILNLMEKAGMAIGLGTFRGVFGKFEVTTWE